MTDPHIQPWCYASERMQCAYCFCSMEALTTDPMCDVVVWRCCNPKCPSFGTGLEMKMRRVEGRPVKTDAWPGPYIVRKDGGE